MKLLLLPVTLLISSATVHAFAPPSRLSLVPTPAATSRAPTTGTSATSLSAFDPAGIASSIGISEDLVLPAAAAALAVVAGAAMSGSGGSSGASGSSSGGKGAKLTVPYDAAAQMSYEKNTPRGTRSLAGYQKYKDLYSEKAVAEVKIKVLERRIASISEEMDDLNESMPM